MVQRNTYQSQGSLVTLDVEPCATVPTGQSALLGSPTKLLLTPQEAALALCMSRSSLYKLLLTGEIPSIKVGRMRRISLIALQQWVIDQPAA